MNNASALSPRAKLLEHLSCETPLSLVPRLGWRPVQYLVGAAALGGAGLLLTGLTALALKSVAVWLAWSALIVLCNQLAHWGDSWLSRAIHCLHAHTMELNGVGTAARRFPFSWSSAYLAAKGPEDGPIVVLCHGYLSFAGTFHDMREKLVQAKYRVYVMNMGIFQSIESYALQLDALVQKIQKETGRTDISLVTHSCGGLVASHWVMYHAPQCGAKVGAVITIGSPLAGTPMARFAPGQDAHQMTPKHKFHEELRAKMSASEVPFLHIASRNDFVVGLESALLGDAAQFHCVLKDVGHLGILFDQRTRDQAAAWLRVVSAQLKRV